MKIYIAALSNVVGHIAPDMRVLGAAAPHNVLESYHYMNTAKEAEIRDKNRVVFLDSGAFSMFTQNVKLDLGAYAKYIHKNKDIIEVAASQDIIGQGREQENYDRLKELEKLGCKVLPVHHVRDADKWLERYIEEGYEYICLGGLVPESIPYKTEWLDHVWHNYLTNPDGTAKVKVHGFGLTTLQLMFRYPWYSVDSTAWIMISRFGAIIVDLPHADYKVEFSNRSTKRDHIESWHYDCLDEYNRETFSNRLAELEAARIKMPEFEEELEFLLGYKPGYNPEAFATSYGWRGHFTIHYFDRIQARRTATFKRVQGTLFT